MIENKEKNTKDTLEKEVKKLIKLDVTKLRELSREARSKNMEADQQEVEEIRKRHFVN